MDKAEIEKRLGELAGQGKSFQEISDALVNEKVPTLSGKGTWNKGTVFKILKKLPIAEKTEPAKEPDTLRKAYQAVLKEMDGALREIGSLNQRVSDMQTEIDLLKAEIRTLTTKEPYRQKEIDDMLNMTLTQERTGGSDGVLSEILKRLEAIERRIGLAPKEKQSENIAGWTIQRDNRGFYRAFRHIRGKVRGVYLGKSIADEKAVNAKLTSAFQKYAE